MPVKDVNFVLILADDQSWAGTEVQLDGKPYHNHHNTPKIAQLAKDGMTFSRAYAPSSICGPSRNSIMTGRTPISTRFHTNHDQSENVIDGAKLAWVESKKSVTHKSIAEYLKDNNPNIKTAHFGKWHLYTDPRSAGFDVSDGATGNDEGNFKDPIEDGVPLCTAAACEKSNPDHDPKRMKEITEKGNNFITDNKDANFYLQLSHYAVHEDSQYFKHTYEVVMPNGGPDFGGWIPWTWNTLSDDRKALGAMMADLDTHVGETVETLRSQGILGKTYVIYTSDNGAPGDANLPLHGGKRTMYDGGFRVPLIIRGPGIPKGRKNALLMSLCDLLPTVHGLAGGIPKKRNKDLDGVNLMKSVRGDRDFRPPQKLESKFFVFPNHYDDGDDDGLQVYPQTAVVSPRWKFIINMESGERELYSSVDMREHSNKAYQGTYLTDTLTEWRKLRNHFWGRNGQYPQLKGSGDDRDGDGIPDEWEFKNLLTAAYDESSDVDGDGLNLKQEYEAGTDPIGTAGMLYVPVDFAPEDPTGRLVETDERIILKIRSATTARKQVMKCVYKATSDAEAEIDFTFDKLREIGDGQYLMTFRGLPSKQQVSHFFEYSGLGFSYHDENENGYQVLAGIVNCPHIPGLDLKQQENGNSLASHDAESVTGGGSSLAVSIAIPLLLVVVMLGALFVAAVLTTYRRRKSHALQQGAECLDAALVDVSDDDL